MCLAPSMVLSCFESASGGDLSSPLEVPLLPVIYRVTIPDTPLDKSEGVLPSPMRLATISCEDSSRGPHVQKRFALLAKRGTCSRVSLGTVELGKCDFVVSGNQTVRCEKCMSGQTRSQYSCCHLSQPLRCSSLLWYNYTAIIAVLSRE